jgi:hypothetical protein
MDKKSQALITAFILIVALSVASTFYRYIVRGDIQYATDEVAFQEALLNP